MRRVRTPLRIQMERAECGAVALGIVLEYYGKYVPLEQLRQVCGVSRHGSRASGMITAAREYGLEAQGWRREVLDVVQMPVPHIVFWNMNHFMVIEGYSREYVWLNDPQTGHRRISADEFTRGFTGVVLTFQPTTAFVADGKSPSLIRHLWQLSKGNQLRIIFLLTLSLLTLFPTFMIPQILERFTADVLIAAPDRSQVAFVQLLIVTLVTSLIMFLQMEILLRLKLHWWMTLPVDFFWRLLHLPIPVLQQRLAGELATRAELPYRLVELASDGLGSGLLSIVWIAVYALLLGQYNLWLALLGLCLLVFNIVFIRLDVQRELQHRLALSRSRFGAMSLGGLFAIETLKVQSGSYWQRLMGEQAHILATQGRLLAFVQRSWLFPMLLTTTALSAALAIGGLQIIAGVMAGGVWLAIQWLLSHFLLPANDLLWLGTRCQEAQAINQRIEDIPLQSTQALPARPFDEGLYAAEVSFHYQLHDPPVINQLNLRLAAKQWGGVVGKNGCGKSTLARLVAGLYIPQTGVIAVPSKIALVESNSVLFSGTIRENITLWDENVSYEKMEHSARIACIHEEIMQRGGYECMVEEGGRNFSSGQRQRLELARALASQPQLLILDEATAAIDPDTEAKLLSCLRDLPISVLLISHRHSVVCQCDIIAVLQDGRIVETGTHDELVAQGGAYTQLQWSD